MEQHTKGLQDKLGAALNTLATDHAAQLKKLTEYMYAASAAKTDLDRQVAKLNEDLAGSVKEAEKLKEEPRQAETLLDDV